MTVSLLGDKDKVRHICQIGHFDRKVRCLGSRLYDQRLDRRSVTLLSRPNLSHASEPRGAECTGSL